MARSQIDIYLHSSKESNCDKGEALGLKDEALERFMYAAYEVKLTYSVDMETGEYTMLAVDDHVLGSHIKKGVE